MKNKKLVWELYPYYILIIFVSIFLIFIYSATFFKSLYLNQVSTHLETQTLIIEKPLLSLLHTNRLQSLSSYLLDQGKDISTRFTVINANGDVLGDSNEDPSNMDNHRSRPEIIDALSGINGEAIRYSKTLQTKMLYFAKPIIHNGTIIGVIRSSIPISEIDVKLKDVTVKMMLWAGLIIIFSTGLGLIFSRKISRPFNALIHGASQFSKGNFDHQIVLPKINEFRTLAIALNNMANELKLKMDTILNVANEKDTILSNMIEGIITVDKDERITTMNNTALQYFSENKGFVIGHYFNEIIRHTKLKEAIQNVLLTQENIQLDISIGYPEKIFLNTQVICLFNSNQECMGVLIVLHNITQLKKLEDIRKNFVANVSHELKTPITLIKGFLETLLLGAAENKTDRDEFLNIIQNHTNRLDDIIEDLLSLSRIEQGNESDSIEKETCDLNIVIERANLACETKALEKNLSIVVIPSKPIYMNINPSLMEQAIINLIDNAIKYTNSEKEIKIILKHTDTESIITVLDQGCGIDHHHLPRLFERFYRIDNARSRELGGTGLGLAIVKHIAQVHNGSVRVESNIGIGSSFSIHIPKKNNL